MNDVIATEKNKELIAVPRDVLEDILSRLERIETATQQKYEVWCEAYFGHVNQGDYSLAQKLGEARAANFDEAVKKVKDKDKNSSYYRKNSDGNWSFFGCRIYDNEEDARAYEHRQGY